MMKLRYVQLPMFALGLSLLGGCGGSYSGVAAVAPGPQADLTSSVGGGGQYSVYRAKGYVENTANKSVERVWTVSAHDGEPLGFKWQNVPGRDWDPGYGPHLIAYAGSQSYDLGPYNDRNVRYVWAGSQGDVEGYFNAQAGHKALRTMTMY